MKNTLLLTVLLMAGTYCHSFAGKYAEVVRGFYTSIDAGDFDKATAYLSAEVKATLPFSPEPFDLNGYKAIGMSMKAGFPDMEHRILEITEGKGACAFKAIFSGTNTASLQGNPPTGNRVETPFHGYLKFNKSGKISEVNILFDAGSFNAQLMKGIPPPQNKAAELTNSFFNEVIGNKHQQGILDKILAPGFVSAFPAPNSTRSQFIDAIKGVLSAFPDIRSTIVHQYSEGNRVFSHGYWDATNTGSFMGMPVTGKKVRVEFMDIWTEDGGKLVKNDVVMDIAGLMTQLGDPEVVMREKNTATVQNLYAAFGKGDVPTVLSYLSDDVVWTDAGTAVGNLHTGVRRGKAAVSDFFKELNNSIAIEDFKVNDYIASGNKVVAAGHYKGKAKSTAKQVSTDFTMIWEFDQAGKISKHHIYLDTDNIAKALTGVNNNLAVARRAYEDFISGNVDGIMAGLSENILWMHAGDAKKIPFAGTYQGKDQLLKFFQSVDSNVDIVSFEPYDFVQTGNTVTNKIKIVGKAMTTGSKYEHTLNVKWTFDSNGKVTRWEGTGDVSSLESAFAGLSR